MHREKSTPKTEEQLNDYVANRVSSGNWVRAKDFEAVPLDDEGKLIEVTYKPDRTRGLTDPRRRVAVVDTTSGVVVSFEDRYPLGYSIALFAVMGVLTAIVGGVLYWSRKFQLAAEVQKRELDELEKRRQREAAHRLRNAGV